MARLDNQRASDGISSSSIFKYNLINKIDKVIVEITEYRGYLSTYGTYNRDSILGRIMNKFVRPYSKQSGYTAVVRKTFAKSLEERNKELLKEIEINKMHIQLCRKNNVEIVDKTK